jgi:fructosamine-3-kinase
VTSVRYELSQLGHGEAVASITGFSHGAVCDAWLVTYEDASRIVAKTSLGSPPDMFATEAAGLQALAGTGFVPTVGVIALSERVLLLEALGPPSLESPAAWERLAAQVASLHRRAVGTVFGWERDGYLGWLPQENGYMADGHRFFAERRLLRYLREPPAETALEPADR